MAIIYICSYIAIGSMMGGYWASKTDDSFILFCNLLVSIFFWPILMFYKIGIWLSKIEWPIKKQDEKQIEDHLVD